MPLYHLGVLIVHRVTRSLVVLAPRVGPIAWANGEANRGNAPDAARWAHLDWQPKIVDLHISGSWVSILNNNTTTTQVTQNACVLSSNQLARRSTPVVLFIRRRRQYRDRVIPGLGWDFPLCPKHAVPPPTRSEPCLPLFPPSVSAVASNGASQPHCCWAAIL